MAKDLPEPYMIINSEIVDGKQNKFHIILQGKDIHNQEHSITYIGTNIYNNPEDIEAAEIQFYEHTLSGRCSGCQIKSKGRAYANCVAH